MLGPLASLCRAGSEGRVYVCVGGGGCQLGHRVALWHEYNTNTNGAVQLVCVPEALRPELPVKYLPLCLGTCSSQGELKPMTWAEEQ